MERFDDLGTSELARLALRRALLRQEGLAQADGASRPEGAESLPDETSTRPLTEQRSIIPFKGSAHAPLMPEPVPPVSLCPQCKGAGYTRRDVPYGHPGFGKPQACTCKQARKHAARRALLWEQSNIDRLVAFQEASFSSFQFWLRGVRPAYEQAVEWAKEPQGWLILAGGNGCGKTHLAVSIAKYCLEEGAMVLFAVVPDLLDSLRATFSPDARETYEEQFRQMREAEVLILDDFGAEHSTDWATEKLFQLLNYRYNGRMATVFTTNHIGFEGLTPRLRSRLCDRRLVRMVMIEAEDYRQLP